MERHLIRVAKELNVGMGTVVEFLTRKGFVIENRPISKVTDVMYDALSKKFSDSKTDKQKGGQIAFGVRPMDPAPMTRSQLKLPDVTTTDSSDPVIPVANIVKRPQIILPNPIIGDNITTILPAVESKEKREIVDGKVIFHLWQFIEFNNKWRESDTSKIDDIAPSWFSRREKLKENSREYIDFINRLKREHAIETGVVERLYDLKKGITETFIKEGFVQSFLSHGDTNVPTQTLMNHLKDHLEAVDFVFDIVKENRPLTTSFIKELHQLVTRHQPFAEGRDQFGTKTNVDLLRGTYKIRENNPTREDGTLVLYCSPDHVAAEMDNLVSIYNDLVEQKIHPIIISAWVHHAFTTIHPFQDGNGRVARLLASLILIKFNYFPFTVLREEARVKYIDALEKADTHQPQMLVDYFAQIQRRNIEKALNIKEVTSTSLLEVADIFSKKLDNWHQKQYEEFEKHLTYNRKYIFDTCFTALDDFKKQLKRKFNGGVEMRIESAAFDEHNKQQFYYRQIIQYAIKHDYYFNRTLPKAWILFKMKLSPTKQYQLGFALHHFGYENTAIAIGAFLEFKDNKSQKKEDLTLPLDIKPHVISIQDDLNDDTMININSFIEGALTLALAQMASELT